MAATSHDFPYTRHIGAHTTALGTIGFLLVGESLIVFLLIAIFSDGALQWGLMGAFTLLLLLIMGWVVSPRWSSHRLTERHLEVRYGLSLTARIPREALVAARPAQERLGMMQPLMAQHDAERRRIVAALSDHGQVALWLDAPRTFRVGLFDGGPTEQLLINVDEPEALLQALALPQVAPTTEAPPIPVPTRPSTPITYLPSARLPQPRSAGQPPAIQLAALTRRYGDFLAVDGLNLTIQPGEIYGFLGANGAGKTTTIKMLVGLLRPSEGQVLVGGHDVWAAPMEAKATFGYVADRALLYERLSGREFLEFLAQIRGLPTDEATTRIEALLDLLDLRHAADRACGAYSFGMQRKLALAGALLHRPSVLILDEPLNGLDPRSARRLKDLFGELAAEGTTILLSTHDLATAEAVCDRVGIIHRGRLVAEGAAAELRGLTAAPDLETLFLSLTGEEVAA